jgi:ferredoxin-NADP reductase
MLHIISVVSEMPKSKATNREGQYLNVKLTPELQKKLDAYTLAVANKKGRIPFALRTRIALMALEEWFEKHGDNLDIF